MKHNSLWKLENLGVLDDQDKILHELAKVYRL